MASSYVTKAHGLLRIVPATCSMETVEIRDSTILKFPVSSGKDTNEEKQSSPPNNPGTEVIGDSLSKGKKKAIKIWGGAEGMFKEYPDTKKYIRILIRST